MSAPELAGRTVLVTRTREQAAGIVDALHRLGARVVTVPLIATTPIASPADVAAAIQSTAGTAGPRWVAFTSATAVRLVVGAVGAAVLAGFDVAAVGPATATELGAAGIEVRVVPSEAHTAAALGAAMVACGVRGAMVWLPCAAGAADDLERALAVAGARVTATRMYRSDMPAQAPQRVRAALRDGVDAITLTSASTARHLGAALAGVPIPSHVVVACIGPETAAEAQRAGIAVTLIAPLHTAEGLADALRVRFAAAQPLR